MIDEVTIRKLVDYLLLNACSINSSGLYNGKAGIAWALFEVARYLQDEYIEEQAFDLLQEALISKTDDIGFENGLGGIGHVLIYLIKDGFIDADFDELFGEKYEKILSGFEKARENPKALQDSIRLNYFLTAVKSYRHPVDKRIDEAMKGIFEANELFLAIQFFDFKDIHYINNKTAVLSKFETYLKVVCECGYGNYSRVVLDDYADLYGSGRVKSSYKIAYYLEKLDKTGQYNDVIGDNKRFSFLDDVRNVSLRDRVELSQLSGNDKYLSLLLTGEENGIEKTVLKLMPPGVFKAGYEQGVSRLLIYLTDKKTILL
jgi:hypothetical protein